MNHKTSLRRGLGRASALGVVAAVTLLTTGCIVHVHFGSSASTAQPPYPAELAYAQCMRTHGVPNFPDPSPSGSSSYSEQLSGSPGSPVARANDACKHLLTGSSTATNGATSP
jgi:hypothetical protein